MSEGERQRSEVEGTRGVVVALLGGPGKQEVARAASALATELLRCEGRKTTGGKRRWAGPVKLGRLGCQVSNR